MPGVLNRMAGTAPPIVAPFITPTRNPKTRQQRAVFEAKIDMRMGRDMAIVDGPPSPGVAPHKNAQQEADEHHEDGDGDGDRPNAENGIGR